MFGIASGLALVPTMHILAQTGIRSAKPAVVSKVPQPAQTEQQSKASRQLDAIYGRSGSQTTPSGIQLVAGEETQRAPRLLNNQPATRSAIQESKPAASRTLFPMMFSRKKPTPAPTQSAHGGDSSNADVNSRLKELYERDGRPVPEYMLDNEAGIEAEASALTTADGNADASFGSDDSTEANDPKRFQRVQPATEHRAANAPMRAQTAVAEMPAASRSSRDVQQVSTNPFKRFFSKLNPLKKSSDRDPKSEKPGKVEPMPESARRDQQLLQQGLVPPAPISPTSNPALQTAPNNGPVFALEPVEVPSIELPSVDTNALELTLPKAPALLRDESTLNPDDLPEFKPAVDLNATAGKLSDMGKAAISEVENKIPTLTEDIPDAPIGLKADPLANPFPELSEDQADSGKVKENPFTGLTLDAKDGSGSIAAEPPALTIPADQPELPAASTGPLELPSNPKVPMLSDEPGPFQRPIRAAKPTLPESPLPNFDDTKLPVVKTESGNADSKQDDHSDNLQKIAERKELKGLKGFCPVELRDKRGLLDAMPQFKSEFEGVTYNFSSLEAKQKFDKSPSKYAPAVGGHDVVSSNDDVQVTGSLDHAVWFKDRLYMFANEQSMQTFVIDPAKFAVAE